MRVGVTEKGKVLQGERRDFPYPPEKLTLLPKRTLGRRRVSSQSVRLKTEVTLLLNMEVFNSQADTSDTMRPVVLNVLSNESGQDKKILICYEKTCNPENKFVRIIGISFVMTVFIKNIIVNYSFIFLLFFLTFSVLLYNTT